MEIPLEFQIPIAVGFGAFLLVLMAEKLHERRCRVVARLATGPSGQPRSWVRLLPLTRALALGGMAWALTTIAYGSGGVFTRKESGEDRREHRRHVAFVADLSPSMSIEDAGPEGDMRRSARIYEVVDGILQRLDGDVLFSVIGFYTDAMPIVVDAEDAELVRNVFNGLPVHYVMTAGKTDLGMGVREALEHVREYPEKNTTVFVCTDGDTLPMQGVPKPPAAVRDVYILGVGNPHQGTFIDDHLSRQDVAVLRTLAGRLHGQYIDVNEKHVSTLALGSLAMGVGGEKRAYDLFDVAILVFAAGATLIALIPVLLEYFGSDWKTVRPRRTVAGERGIS
jgi:Ca-activated chloride channel family protein